MSSHFNLSSDFARPQHPDDIEVGVYYWGAKCGHCAETSPIVNTINEHMVGGWIRPVETTDIYKERQAIKHDSLKKEFSPGLRESFKRGAIEATPTWHWADGLKTVGAPFEERSLNREETIEYLCVRACKCWMKEANPDMGTEQINEIIDQVFEGRMVEGPDGRNPFKGVTEITWRF